MGLKNKILALVVCCAGSLFADVPVDQKFAELKAELGLSEEQRSLETRDCHLYLVHHGDTEYTVEERLQGWIDIPLNEMGREQMRQRAQELALHKVSAIYSSSLTRAVESAEILQDVLGCPVVIESALRGESHGNLEGMRCEEYAKDPHFMQYKSLPSAERIFFSVGDGGLSKADVARYAIPAIRDICRKHPGENVIIVTHGGVLKFIHFLLGNYTLDRIDEVAHGEMLRIDGDGSRLMLVTGEEQSVE